MAWKKVILDGDVQAIDPLALTGDVTIVGAGKSLEVINLKAETPTELTIATGDITRTQLYHTVDTEADAASDDLDGINGGADGMMVVIRPANDARTVVVRHNQSAAAVDNILLANGDNCTLDDEEKTLTLIYDVALDTNGAWIEVARGIGAPALLTSSTPQAVDGTAAAVGVATDAARSDHVHALGPLVANLDFNGSQALSLVLEAVATAPDAAAETVGQIYFDTDDSHPYVWQA